MNSLIILSVASYGVLTSLLAAAKLYERRTGRRVVAMCGGLVTLQGIPALLLLQNSFALFSIEVLSLAAVLLVLASLLAGVGVAVLSVLAADSLARMLEPVPSGSPEAAGSP
jgi:hypothetical protein